MGIDFGTRRIGLAISDVDGRIASPLEVVEMRGDSAAVARKVVAVADEYGVDGYVVGLPLNMDGSEGKQAKVSRDFGTMLGKVSGAEVHYWDERLSSHGADVYLAEAELTQKKRKARRDAVAAQIILQTFLDARGE